MPCHPRIDRTKTWNVFHAKRDGLQLKLPHFIPILTTFAARVSGRESGELLQSPSALARSLADTQAVVGHDGVLCTYAPSILVSSCIEEQSEMSTGAGAGGTPLRPAADALRSKPVATVFESIQALRHLLAGRARVYAAFTGPGLLSCQIRDALASHSNAAWADPEYVAEIVLATVRLSLDLKADGVALIEQATLGMPGDLLRVHRKVRKLADFYDSAYLVFHEQGSEEDDPGFPAHCVFDLKSIAHGIGPVAGRVESSFAADDTPCTTAGDIPACTSVAALKSLFIERPAGRAVNDV